MWLSFSSDPVPIASYSELVQKNTNYVFNRSIDRLPWEVESQKPHAVCTLNSIGVSRG